MNQLASVAGGLVRMGKIRFLAKVRELAPYWSSSKERLGRGENWRGGGGGQKSNFPPSHS